MCIASVFAQHHQICDDAYIKADAAVADERWPEAAIAFDRFRALMERHLSVEEERLFPRFEAATGIVAGPTRVMRIEHQQLRALFDEMAAAVRTERADNFSGAGETMMMMMAQHNLKEENVLYPACDRALQSDPGLLQELIVALQAP
jgi:hemerythrin-like domain-containing protein